ncbi:hypothetical protein EB73_33930 [Mycobacterium sp. SWH-M3]|nr:hypothetical protein EB73_33930 [Mycobacterium sp. SWH-M3]
MVTTVRSSKRSAFLAILVEHKVIGPVEGSVGTFRVACQGCDWHECTDHQHQAIAEGDEHIVDLLLDAAGMQPVDRLADVVPASGPVTAVDLRRAIEAQCEVADGSVAGYVTVDSVLDLVDLASTLNYLIRARASVR